MCKKQGFMLILLVGVLASAAFAEYSVSESQSSKTTSKESKKVSLNVNGCRVEARFEKSNTDPGTLTLNVTDKGKEKARTFVLKGAEVNGAALLQRQDLSGSEKEAVREVLKSLKLSGETDEAGVSGAEAKVYGEDMPQAGNRVMLAPPDRVCPSCGRPYDQGGVTGGVARAGSVTSYAKVGAEASSSSAVVHRVQSNGATQVQIGAAGLGGFLVPPTLLGSPQAAAGATGGPQTAADFRSALQVPDSQWPTLEPALQKVLDSRSEQKSLMEKYLTGLTQQKDEDARKALKAYKEKAREDRKQLAEAREALRKVLTPRQEAELILLGVLE
jgi:hypothetical protein